MTTAQRTWNVATLPGRDVLGDGRERYAVLPDGREVLLNGIDLAMWELVELGDTRLVWRKKEALI